MIFFMQDSEIGVGTLIFYTCIYYPILQAKRSLLAFIALFSCLFRRPLECSIAGRYNSSSEDSTCCSIHLPMERYGDLKNRSTSGCCDGDEMCSVCLVEFECEDYVSELCKCGHVFHINCIDKWVERNHFTCPLCRSIFLYSS